MLQISVANIYIGHVEKYTLTKTNHCDNVAIANSAC